MKEPCRICGRELCGTQRRWIFHTASRLNLQVLLSHALGRDVCRDGKGEFACGKCAFMLDRIYRFDTVIARIEALSLERLQRLLQEKDRLKLCVASLYRRHNADAAEPRAAPGATVDISGLPDARYAALLQEDFAYSGFECWVEPDEQSPEPHSCHAPDGPGSRPRRCRGCAALRVADADYEAICRVPRKVARSISCGPSSRWSASTCAEEPALAELGPADAPSAKAPPDGDSMEEGTPASSVESLDASLQASPPRPRDEEAERGGKELAKWDCCPEELQQHLGQPTLELALSVIKGLDYKPIQSPRGSRLPIPVKSKHGHGGGADAGGAGLPHRTLKPLYRTPIQDPLEISDLQELWDDLCEEYLPLRVQSVSEDLLKPQKLNSNETTIIQQTVCDSHVTELQQKIQQTEATNKILQERLSEMSYELKSAQESSQKQDGTNQSLKEMLKSKESEIEELYQVIEGQNDTMAKLREMLHQSQLGQLHSQEGIAPAQQQVALLDLQSALFCSQLEIQKLQRAVQQKERQLANAKQRVQAMEVAAQGRERQKEASWKHNQDLRKALQQLQAELQTKSQQLHSLEAEKYHEIRTQEQTIQHLNHSLSHKEQLLQEYQELLQYRNNSDKTLETNELLLEKLRQRIQDRAVALERAIDEKFSALEDKDKELRQLHLAVRERDHDLERLRGVLSANEATMQSMESLLRAKGLEVEQLTATCQNLQWLKEELETKLSHWQKEQESIVQQLQTSLHDRNKEVEGLSATLLCKLGPGQSEIAEELCQRLQRKERMLQDLLSDRSKQAVEHEMEIQGLLQSLSTREQESQAAAEKMVQALMERNSELQALRQYIGGKELTVSQMSVANQQTDATAISLHPGEQTDQGSMQIPSRDESTSLTAREDASIPRSPLGDLDTITGLEKELSNAKEELELMAKKERESQMELSALQSMMAVQEEELQVQAADLESLTRNVQIKEDLIKDLQMQLVDPEDIPAMERLTQEVLVLREKVASVESQSQETSGNRRQQLLLMLEGLVDERSRLNEALQAERQLYSSLVKFHAHPENSERDRTLQVELEGAQVLRSRLEEVLGRSLERLSRLETLAAIGGAAAGEDTEDASTEFTDSIEEEAAQHGHPQPIKVASEKSLAAVEPQDLSLGPPSPSGEGGHPCSQKEILHLRAEVHRHLEEKRRAEGELRELKAQMEEAGFSSVAHIRNAMLSLCLENAELQEQLGEAMSDGWEVEEDKEQGEAAPSEDGLQDFRKLQGRLKNAHSARGLPEEQLPRSTKEGQGQLPTPRRALATEPDGAHSGLACPPGKRQRQEQEPAATRPAHGPQSLSPGAGLAEDAKQPHLCGARAPGPQAEFGLFSSTKHLRAQLAQCRQRYQDLQEKLLISEATVFAQANQLEKYRVLLGDSLVKQDSKQVQVDLQDLGYETCGRSENEAEREESTSPECEEQDSPRALVLAEGLSSPLDRGPAVARPGKKPRDSHVGKPPALQAYGQSEDIAELRKDIQELKGQLQSAHGLIQSLRGRVRSVSATSDYSSSLERPRKPRAGGSADGPSPPSATDEDEGWLSDGAGAFYPPGLQARKDLESLIRRVAQLEAQLPKTELDGKLGEQLPSAAWPGKYDSLIQDQARELSYLRQKVREGRGLCYLLSQHARDTVKSFEDLLRSNDIDYYLGQSFREQLAQGSQLTHRLASKLSTKDHKNEKEQAGLEPLALRLSKELQEKEKVIEVLQAKLDAQSFSPPSSHTLSDSQRSASSTSFLSDELEACSDMDGASEDTYEDKKAAPGHSDSIRHSSHPAVLSSKPSTTSPSQGAKAGPTSSPAGFPAPRTPLQEVSQARPGAGTVPPAPAAPLQGLHPDAISAPCLSPAHAHPPRRVGPEELGGILEPGCQWDMMRPQKGSACGDLSSGSSVCQLTPRPTGADLLEEHLGEIRNLRQRLEESICVNDRLREQLQHRLSAAARDSGSTVHFGGQGLESMSQLCKENRVLKEENRSLQAQLSHTARGHSQEMGQLREALLSAQSRLHELEKELEQQKGSKEQLLEDLQEKQQEVLRFREERLSLRENDSRLQHRLTLLQQECEEKQQLFHSLQSELRLYEALYGNAEQSLRASSLGACHQGPVNSDLSRLVANIGALRAQLEQSIQVNAGLRLQLEQQLDRGTGKASLSPPSVGQAFPSNQPQPPQDSAASPPVRDVGVRSSVLLPWDDSLSAPGSDTAVGPGTTGRRRGPALPALEGEATDGCFANKNGRHVVGHVDDYSALREQIGEAKLLVQKILALALPARASAGLVPQHAEGPSGMGAHELGSSAGALGQALEEASALLTMFWRAALPSSRGPLLSDKVGESTERELQDLRGRVCTQEKLLQSTAERLRNASRQRESLERFIVSQLTRTHDVLKKARTNLEVQPLRVLLCAPALGPV